LSELMEKAKSRNKEDILESFRASLHRNNKYKKLLDGQMDELRNLKIENERLQRNNEHLMKVKLNSNQSADTIIHSKQSVKENIEYRNGEIKVKKIKPILMAKSSPAVPKAGNPNGMDNSNAYIPNGRGGTGSVLNFNGKIMFY
jgi:hypothetical protein